MEKRGERETERKRGELLNEMTPNERDCESRSSTNPSAAANVFCNGSEGEGGGEEMTFFFLGVAMALRNSPPPRPHLSCRFQFVVSLLPCHSQVK